MSVLYLYRLNGNKFSDKSLYFNFSASVLLYVLSFSLDQWLHGETNVLHVIFYSVTTVFLGVESVESLNENAAPTSDLDSSY